MSLADMGAEVVKVERPGDGDDGRLLGPPFIAGESAYFLSVNRNKRSIVLNLKDTRGVAILRKLAAVADVVVENFRPGTMAALGLPLETIRSLNPRIITCSISGYGQTGPDANLPGYDLVIQGEGGVMSLTGEAGGPAYRSGASQADIIAGMTACQGILTALLVRERTGRGQHVDVGMLDCQIALLTYHAGIYLATSKSPSRRGNQHPTVAPFGTYQGSDGTTFTLACASSANWQSLCRALDRSAWTEDARFRTNSDRVQHREALDALLAALFATQETTQWVTVLRAAGVPCGPVNTVAGACEHPQVLAREMIVTVEHPTVGHLRTTGIPVKLSETPGAIRTPPPLLGEHTVAVLQEWLHMEATDMAALKTEGIV